MVHFLALSSTPFDWLGLVRSRLVPNDQLKQSLNRDVWVGLAAAINQAVQLRILHVAQNPSGVIQLSVVEIGEGGDRLGIQIRATRLQHQALR